MTQRIYAELDHVPEAWEHLALDDLFKRGTEPTFCVHYGGRYSFDATTSLDMALGQYERVKQYPDAALYVWTRIGTAVAIKSAIHK